MLCTSGCTKEDAGYFKGRTRRDDTGGTRVLKEDLKALNSSVVVEQEEYDEIVAIKPMFLVMDYR